MPSILQLEQTLSSADYYFATLMSEVVSETLELEPVDEAKISKADNLFYTIEALQFLVNRGIDTSNSTCQSVYNELMSCLGVYTTLPDLDIDSTLIVLSPNAPVLSLSLNSLSDVDIQNPQNGDVLTYDSSLNKWVAEQPQSGGVVAYSDLNNQSSSQNLLTYITGDNDAQYSLNINVTCSQLNGYFRVILTYTDSFNEEQTYYIPFNYGSTIPQNFAEDYNSVNCFFIKANSTVTLNIEVGLFGGGPVIYNSRVTLSKIR